MARRYSKKKGPVRSKKVEHDGIKFQSGLEKHMYIALKKAKIKSQYEGQTYELVPSFNFKQEAYERQGNGKGEYRDRGNKKITYQRVVEVVTFSLTLFLSLRVNKPPMQ